MVPVQEMTHRQFVDAVDRARAMGRTVGLWPAGLTFTDDRSQRPRWWKRRHIDHARLVVYIRRQHRHPSEVLREIRRAIVRHGGKSYPPDVRIARARALARLAERENRSC